MEESVQIRQVLVAQGEDIARYLSHLGPNCRVLINLVYGVVVTAEKEICMKTSLRQEPLNLNIYLYLRILTQQKCIMIE